MPALDSKRRWYHLSPDRFVLGLLLGVCALWLSDRFRWFGFNHHKGWTVLISLAAVGVATLVMLLWWVVSVAFRWRFQFGIRSLFAFCLAASLAVSWLAVERQRARRQNEVVEELRSSDGAVAYDWEFDAEGNAVPSPEPPTRGWLRKMLGDDFLSVVVHVVLNFTEISDAGLEHVKRLTDLQELDLAGTKVTDAGLENLVDLPHLRRLDVSDTRVTDAGLTRLEGLTQLQGSRIK